MLGSHITCWFLLVVINDYIYIVLPIAGRLLTDSFILHCYCSLVHTRY